MKRGWRAGYCVLPVSGKDLAVAPQVERSTAALHATTKLERDEARGHVTAGARLYLAGMAALLGKREVFSKWSGF